MALVILLNLVGCNKQDISNPNSEGKVTLRLTLKGIHNFTFDKNAFSNKLDGLQVQKMYETHDGFESTSSFTIDAKEKIKSASAAIGSEPSRLEEGVTYRLLVYHVNDQNEQEFFDKMDYVTRRNEPDGPIISANLGDKIKWYIYSYNDKETIPEIEDLDNPIVPMGINRDFVYASGEVEITEDLNPMEVILQRKTALIAVEIDARGLFTDEIRSMTFSLPANILKTSNFDIKGGINVAESVIGLPQQTIPLSSFTNIDEGYNDRKLVYLHTAVPEVWNNFSFSLQNLSILLDNSAVRSFPTTVFAIAKQFNIEPGKRYRAKMDLIESALTFGGVSWARENLYRTQGTRNPYRFYHENKQTDDFRSYFSFKGHIPGKWGSTVIGEQRDPCTLVYPANRWMQPTKASFLNLTRTSTNLTTDGILPTVVSNLTDILATEATTNAVFGSNYIEYNTAQGSSAVYPESSNVLRFYYNGYDPIDINVLGDGWVNVNVIDTYGKATALWTSEQGLNVLGLVGAGAWGYFGSTRQVFLSSQFRAKGINSIQLLNVDALGLNVVSSARKNVRCIRNPNWETLSQQAGYNPEPNYN